MTPPGRAAKAYGAGLVLMVAAMVVGALVGAVHLPVGAVLGSFIDRLPFIAIDTGLSPSAHAVLWELRVPRVVLAACVGGSLAIAGAGYQGVFRNPLVDPYLLGAAAGAGLGATLVIALWPGASPAVLPAAAFGGALGGVMLSYAVGVMADSTRATSTLVLAGVAVSAFLTSLQTFLLQQNADSLRGVYGWILGQLGRSDWSDIAIVAPYMIVAAAVIIANARWLNVLSSGDDKAASLGIRPARVRLAVVVAASLATAAAVAVSGLIAFVGLVVPHIVRRLAGHDNRLVLPLSLLAGAAFLVMADTVARTALAPEELPVGVVTAFLGAPFFALLLRRTAVSGR